MTINVQGRQWYWHYAYPDNGNFAFDSYPIPPRTAASRSAASCAAWRSTSSW